MKLNRAVAIQSHLKGRLGDVYASARIFHLTSKQLNKRAFGIYDGLPKDIPRHVREFIRGYEARLQDELYQRDLEFCYLYDGVLYSTHKESTHRLTEEFYDRNEGHLLCNCPNGHYWKGTNKPYFTGENHE